MNRQVNLTVTLLFFVAAIYVANAATPSADPTGLLHPKLIIVVSTLNVILFPSTLTL